MPRRAADVVLLATDGTSTRAIFHALAAQHAGVRVVLEDPIRARTLLRGRLKRLGRRTVVGQLLFQACVQRTLALTSRPRIAEIAREYALDLRPLPSDRVQRVGSANGVDAIETIKELAPRVVVLSGTRIITRKTLDAVAVRFVNMHAGITPRYRGVHGGYWALVDGRADLVGTTIHLVDPGIDTGVVLEQVRFTPTPRDNFATYPYLHLAHGLPALLRQVSALLEDRVETRAPLDPESRLRYHPTLREYLRAGVP